MAFVRPAHQLIAEGWLHGCVAPDADRCYFGGRNLLQKGIQESSSRLPLRRIDGYRNLRASGWKGEGSSGGARCPYFPSKGLPESAGR